jgi:hypothetical protein
MCWSGFPLGGLLSLSIAGCAAVVLLPHLISVTALSQVMLPVAEAGGKLLLAAIILGVVAATFGAALETTLSAATPLRCFWLALGQVPVTPRAAASIC